MTGGFCKGNGIIRAHARKNGIKVRFSGKFDSCVRESDAVLVIDPYNEATGGTSLKKAYNLAKSLKKPLCTSQNPTKIAEFCAFNNVKTLFVALLMVKNVKYETYLENFVSKLFAKLLSKIAATRQTVQIQCEKCNAIQILHCSHCNKVLCGSCNVVGQNFNNCYKCEADISDFVEHLLATPLAAM